MLEIFDQLPQPIKTPLYRCDKRFHTEPLEAMLMPSDRNAFIVMDGSGLFIGVVSGSRMETLCHAHAHLPKKHSKGGQSAPRFQRIRLDERNLFRKKAQELITKHLIGPDCLPNVDGIVIAGSSNFKSELVFEPRLRPLVLGTLTVQYSGRAGCMEAISASGDLIENARISTESRLLTTFFTRIDREPSLVAFGPKATAAAIHQGAVETLIVSSNEDMGEPFSTFEGTLEVVGDATREGSQFAAGVRVGALLRFPIYMDDEDRDKEDGGDVEDSDDSDSSFC